MCNSKNNTRLINMLGITHICIRQIVFMTSLIDCFYLMSYSENIINYCDKADIQGCNVYKIELRRN